MASIKDYFVGAGGKFLALVDTPEGSNQSEIGKASVFAGFLGDAPRKMKDGNGFEATFFWFPDDEDDRLAHASGASWYDTREAIEHRAAEWRLYYGRGNPVMAKASPGDLCIVALKPDQTLVVIISPAGSTTAAQLAGLFDIPSPDPLGAAATLATLRTTLDAFSKWLLEELNIAVSAETTGQLDMMLKTFGGRLPDTATMSTFARQTAKGIDPIADPDAALFGWFDWEDKLFRELESVVIGEEVKPHLFDASGRVNVEALTDFFLGVHNRRKSRAGHAFAHHIRAIFSANGVLFQSEVNTENAKKLDFMLPNGFLYHRLGIPPALLIALGAKTTCKDRWRQVLSEADQIPDKHLITLEANISGKQLDEMAGKRMRLVIPKPRHWAFQSKHPGNDPLTVADFLALAKSREGDLRQHHGPDLDWSIQQLADKEQVKPKRKPRRVIP
jgi:hypothetical protein